MDLGVLKAAVSKGSEDAIEKNSEIFSLIIENTSDYIALVDMAGKYIYTSPSHKTLGYLPADLLGKNGMNFVHPDDKKRLAPILASAAKDLAKAGIDAISGNKKETIPKSISFRFPDKAGNWHDIESAVNLVKNPLGPGYAILLVSKDMTERKKAEEKLKESEEQYRTIIEMSANLVWTLDTKGNFLFFNKRAEEVSGYTIEELRGKSFAPLIVPQELPRILGVFRDLVSGKTVRFEVSIKRKDKSVFVLYVTASPKYADKKVSGVVCFGEDITEKKKSEDELKQKNEELERFNQLAVGRELKMIELKKRIAELEGELNKNKR